MRGKTPAKAYGTGVLGSVGESRPDGRDSHRWTVARRERSGAKRSESHPQLEDRAQGAEPDPRGQAEAVSDRRTQKQAEQTFFALHGSTSDA